VTSVPGFGVAACRRSLWGGCAHRPFLHQFFFSCRTPQKRLSPTHRETKDARATDARASKAHACSRTPTSKATTLTLVHQLPLTTISLPPLCALSPLVSSPPPCVARHANRKFLLSTKNVPKKTVEPVPKPDKAELARLASSTALDDEDEDAQENDPDYDGPKDPIKIGAKVGNCLQHLVAHSHPRAECF